MDKMQKMQQLHLEQMKLMTEQIQKFQAEKKDETLSNNNVPSPNDTIY